MAANKNHNIVNKDTVLLNDDNDPDLNFFNNLSIHSKYFSIGEASSHLHMRQT